MSLANLVKTGQLKPHVANAAQTQRMIAAAKRNLADARVEEVSLECRFDAGYKAIMQVSMTALMANGYRPSTNVPGHHQTMIQTLGSSLAIPADMIQVLDALRRKRNINDYTGDLIDPDSVLECIEQAANLIAQLEGWLQSSHGALLDPRRA